MTRIGILSDTHGYIHPRVLDFLKPVDDVWHAGDLGGQEVIDQLCHFRSFHAVYGNIDGNELRTRFNEYEKAAVDGVQILMTHIGGYPGRYPSHIRELIRREKPALFIAGHSHILKVMYDRQHGLLHINPGAAGRYGWHKSITAVRLVLHAGELKDLEVLDVPRH